MNSWLVLPAQAGVILDPLPYPLAGIRAPRAGGGILSAQKRNIQDTCQNPIDGVLTG